MMQLVRHPLVAHDLVALVDHIVAATYGDVAAAARRLDEVDDLMAAILATPRSGTRLDGPLAGWLVRHGGRGQRLAIVFRADVEREVVYVALVAFGGQDWITMGENRRSALR
jgi:plasmid stabilization system protein ParE